MSESECSCPDCRQSSPGQRLLRGFSSGKEAARWYEELFGGSPRDFVTDIDACLADRAQARRLVDQLGVEAAVILAILTEAPDGIPLETLVFEGVTILGDGIKQGIDRIQKAGLLFQIRPYNSYGYRNNRVETLHVLPAPLVSWLRPVLGGLLLASRPTPAADPPPPSDRDGSWPEAMVLAAVASLQPRLTSGRLFKRDGERLATLLAPANLIEPAETIVDRLRREHLIGGADGDPPRLQPDWTALAAWAERAPTERARQRLRFRHSGSAAWSALVEAGGDWVEEIHLARRFRTANRVVVPPAQLAGALTEKTWVLERGRSLAIWPEVESLEHDGTVFWRVRPAHAAAGDGRGARAHVQPDFEIVAPPEMTLSDLLFLARVSELRRPDVVATFALTAASVRRAASEGLDGGRIADGLAAIAAHGLPPAVDRAIRDWTGDIGRCAMRVAVLITFDEPGIADRAAALLGPEVERVAPSVLAAPERQALDIEQRLVAAGMAPRVRLTDGSGSDDEEDDEDFDEDFDELTGDPRSPPMPSGGKHAQASAIEPPDPRWVAAVRALRFRGESRFMQQAPTVARSAAAPPPRRAGEPGPSQRSPAARPAGARSLPPGVALQRGVLFGADVAIERQGRVLTVRPLRIVGDDAGPTFEVAIAGAQTTQIVRPQEVQSAVLLAGTARLVARNQPCPCGSGRKFKRCCLDSALAGPTGQGPQPET